VLLPTIFDPSELRSDFNGKVIRAPAALASRDAAVLQRCSFGRRMEKDGEGWRRMENGDIMNWELEFERPEIEFAITH
jgi:hypothetical protein